MPRTQCSAADIGLQNSKSRGPLRPFPAIPTAPGSTGKDGQTQASEILTLFWQWKSEVKAINDSALSQECSDEHLSMRCDEADLLVKKILDLKPVTAHELAAQIIAFTDYGEHPYEDCGDPITKLAISLVEELRP